ncbi:MAG: dipeptidase [Bacillota bacterium]
MKDFIVDGHSDVLLNYLRDENYNFKKNTKFQVDLPKMKKAKVFLEVFAACPSIRGDRALKKTIKIIDKFNYLIKNNKEVELAENYKEIEESISSKKIAAILAIEGADGISNLSTLRIFYELGVRMITLTWNYRNYIADGLNEIEANGGVTKFGKRFIKEMDELGMVIDLSHLTPASFWDVIKYSKNPVVASHSNVKNICNHERNLDDKQIKAIAKKGGLIGINFCPEFIKNNDKVKIDDLIEHINYIKNLVGIEYIGLGTDYDGITETPEQLEDISKLPNLIKELKKDNYSDNEIEKIINQNWLRVFKKVLK